VVLPGNAEARVIAGARWWEGLWLRLLGVALVAGLVRLLALPVLARPEFFFAKYPTLAQEMLRGQGQALTAFAASPLYLYFWTAIHQVFPGFPGAAVLVQMALGVVTCVGVAVAVECWAGRWAGVLGGLAAACYLPFLVNDATFVSEGLVLLCDTSALVCLGRLLTRPRIAWAAGAGIAVGLSGMARPNILLFVPFAAAAVWYGVADSRRVRLRFMAVVVGLALAGPLLITVRNAVVSGQPVLVMSDSGIVLYIGNNELDSGLSYTWPRHEPLNTPRPGEVDPANRVAREVAERECERPLGPRDAARWWTREALRFPCQHPLEYGMLVLRKLRYTWAAVEAHDVQTTFAQEQMLGTWPLLRFGGLAPLALAGLLLSVRRWRSLLPLYGMLATYTVTGLLFTVVARYRLPMVPACIVFAAMALTWFAAGLRRRDWPRLAGALAVLALATAAVNREDFHTRDLVITYRVATTTLNRADAWVDAGDLPRARALYEKVLRDRPSFGLVMHARYAMVLIALREGDPAAAAAWREAVLGPRLPQPVLEGVPEREALTRRVQEDADDIEAWLFLGARLWQEEQYAAAEAAFREVTWRIPTFATGQLNRAWCLFRLGRHAEARRWAEAAARLQPERPDAHALILEAAQAQGRADDLVPEYERLARIYPEITAFTEALGRIRDVAGPLPAPAATEERPGRTPAGTGGRP
jgi:tetratricopeptide (TPR) repeat protein